MTGLSFRITLDAWPISSGGGGRSTTSPAAMECPRRISTRLGMTPISAISTRSGTGHTGRTTSAWDGLAWGSLSRWFGGGKGAPCGRSPRSFRVRRAGVHSGADNDATSETMMPIRRYRTDPRSDTQRGADEEALAAFERGEFLRVEPAIERAAIHFVTSRQAERRSLAASLGIRLGWLRRSHGIPQRQLARVLGTSKSNISRLEGGQRRWLDGGKADRNRRCDPISGRSNGRSGARHRSYPRRTSRSVSKPRGFPGGGGMKTHLSDDGLQAAAVELTGWFRGMSLAFGALHVSIGRRVRNIATRRSSKPCLVTRR